MELVLSSISILHLGAVDAYGTHRLPSQRTRIKQIKLVLPCLGIVSKSNELKVKNKRRSAHYHPSIWDPKLIETLNSPYTNKSYSVRLEELKGDTEKLFKSTRDPFEKLKLVDTIQKLGLAYHFEEEIKDALNLIASSNFTNNDLYTTALKFRLLRQHDYPISSGVFDKFRSQDGRFMDSLNRDAAGLLSLYEASYLGMNGEDDLEEAKKFSSRHLKSLMGKMEGSLAEQVKHSLEIPLHWRMPRLEAWNFVSNVYQNVDTKSTTLLELAKLDYNIVQSVYQKEVNVLSRWWRDLGFKENLSFARDRLMENYLWAMGIVFEPQFFECRIGLTKFICILTVIDDIYDVYGSLDELETFTDTVNRWDMKTTEDLPEYMKICYLAMINYANEIAYAVLKDHGLNIQPQIKEAWTNLCRSYLVEARWFNTNYTPIVNEYLENGWISVGGPSAMVHAYILQGCNIKEHVDCFKYGSKLFYWSSLITRLSDDLGTSKDEIMRGDVMKAIQCYMSEEDISEEQARVRVKDQINFSWKKLNEESARNSLPKSLVNMSLNMARTAQCLFQYGDGIGTSTGVTKDRLTSLIIEPIPIEEQRIVVVYT